MATCVVLHDAPTGHWLRFRHPVRVLEAHRPADVMPLLREAERAVDSEGAYAAGFLSYEAAPAFDSAHRVIPGEPFPLCWFGLFPPPEILPGLETGGPFTLGAWRPSVGREAYGDALRHIKDRIRAGDTYQVNYTFRLHAGFQGDAWSLFCRLVRAQRSSYCAFVETGTFTICSASPELFFRLDGSRLVSRPMKGTAARGLWSADDARRGHALQTSEKDRAENVMIVDMVRNDIGRVADPGTVTTPSLFDVERYPTVWQMTSTVEGTTALPVSGLMASLFPPASITGAPKISTMEIIADLERTSRRIYTGAIGYLAPGRRAQFNVAIRTVLLESGGRTAEYGVGSGIVWGSEAENEYDECLQKSRVLTEERPPFALFETMLWTVQGGFHLLARHLHRLTASAEFFGFPCSSESLERVLRDGPPGAGPGPWKVRLVLDEHGGLRLEWTENAATAGDRPVRLGVARRPVRRDDVFLYHKTTHRRAYEEARTECPGHDDVVLWNESGKVTEATIANVVVRRGTELITPPIECGLLPGTFRESLLEEGRVREGMLTLDDIRPPAEIYLINSVSGWRRGEVVEWNGGQME